MKGRSSLLPVGADRYLPGGAVRWFDARPLRPVRPDCAKHMDDTAERHYTEECQAAKPETDTFGHEPACTIEHSGLPFNSSRHVGW